MSSKSKYHNTRYSSNSRLEYTIGEKIFRGVKTAIGKVSDTASALYSIDESSLESNERTHEVSNRQVNSMLEPGDD